MKIFLGDLVHTWSKSGFWTFPLNVGYIASYAKKKLTDLGIDCQFKLFKDPIKMMDAIEEENPKVVGLAYYVWNAKLNNRIFLIGHNGLFIKLCKINKLEKKSPDKQDYYYSSLYILSH